MLEINQSNVFYNYAIGFDSSKVDLNKTAVKLLETGIAKSVFFSNYKCLYSDEFNIIRSDYIKPENRRWDLNWEITFNPKIPQFVIPDLLSSLEIAFYENLYSHNVELYIRASLPPIVLEDDCDQIPIFSSVKIYSNGIAILSFQLDGSWEALKENDFINNIVNICQRYYKSIWMDSRIQRTGTNIQLNNFCREIFSSGGIQVKKRKIRKTINQMKTDNHNVLDNALKSEGKHFELGGRDWVLHPMAGSENIDSWESSLEFCSAMYLNVIRSMITTGKKTKQNKLNKYIWQGRPSVSLMRFNHQPKNKNDLLQNHSKSITKILQRTSSDIDNGLTLSPDLRMGEDYSLHANRSVILWTWLREPGTSDNAWNETDTPTKLFENQARAEQIEYYNMFIARACHWTHEQSTENHLLNAYETLVNTEKLIHESSNFEEISDTISCIIDTFGTKKLIPSAKEAARFQLDRLKYQSDLKQNRNSYWLAVFFGLFGATSFAEFVIYPLIREIWPKLDNSSAPILSFTFSAILLAIIIILVRTFNNKK